ncbi:uncharacterized protein LOC128558144 [Mercenaria mercenaria]|uniref:uncharacterized protein LOC128558144 n=1 Tax=Mercenaria mercenaria TaxID=6596 RepID=UPI00234EE22B|nr:uncharacterized protein LOC128558144 [Mercenaria mercenaria]
MIKNDWRSRLGDRRLSELIIINAVSQSVSEYNPELAIHHWNSNGTRKRRPFFNDEKKPVSVDEALHADVTNTEDDLPDPDADIFIMAENMEASANSDQDDDDESSEDSDSELHKDILQMQNKAYKMMLDLM